MSIKKELKKISNERFKEQMKNREIREKAKTVCKNFEQVALEILQNKKAQNDIREFYEFLKFSKAYYLLNKERPFSPSRNCWVGSVTGIEVPDCFKYEKNADIILVSTPLGYYWSQDNTYHGGQYYWVRHDEEVCFSISKKGLNYAYLKNIKREDEEKSSSEYALYSIRSENGRLVLDESLLPKKAPMKGGSIEEIFLNRLVKYHKDKEEYGKTLCYPNEFLKDYFNELSKTIKETYKRNEKSAREFIKNKENRK